MSRIARYQLIFLTMKNRLRFLWAGYQLKFLTLEERLRFLWAGTNSDFELSESDLYLCVVRLLFSSTSAHLNGGQEQLGRDRSARVRCITLITEIKRNKESHHDTAASAILQRDDLRTFAKFGGQAVMSRFELSRSAPHGFSWNSPILHLRCL